MNDSLGWIDVSQVYKCANETNNKFLYGTSLHGIWVVHKMNDTINWWRNAAGREGRAKITS